MSHVDTTSPITHVSLCAGYGGIDLGLRRAIPALRTIAVSEIESFACANLVAKMEAGLLDPAPIWTDLKTFPWAEFRDRVDILSGGYPCQPFSAAGKRLGTEDPRHLWPHISAGIALMRPAVCFFENVEGHISLGLPDVIEDLAGLGYRTTWGIFSASEVGAPHQRKRVFILAYRKEQGLEGYRRLLAGGVWNDAGTSSTARGMDNANAMAAGGISGVLGSAQGEEQGEGLQRQRPGHAAGYAGQATAWPSRPGEQQHWWEPPRVVANDHRAHAGHGEQRPERTLGDLSGGCGEAMGNTSSQRCKQAERAVRSEQQPSGTGEECGLGVAEAMGNSASLRGEMRQDIHAGNDGQGFVEGRAAMGNAAHTNRRSRVSAEEAGAGPKNIWRRRSGESGERQTQSSLGGNLNGPADWLDDAELFTTCDNRTDELRLLGNGVVPATAERAFRVLVSELIEYANQ